MPTYQYVCDACGTEFEEFQSMTDEPVAACPSCGARPRRLISGGAGFLFKGSGFYQTDYRSKDYVAKAKKDSSDSAVSKADSKSDSKSSSSSSSSKSSSTSKPASGSSGG